MLARGLFENPGICQLLKRKVSNRESARDYTFSGMTVSVRKSSVLNTRYAVDLIRKYRRIIRFSLTESVITRDH